jgi:alcohol dehydrogenase
MKAFVYGGPGLKGLEDRPKPAIQAAGDAIVKIVKTICGTDLHILKGDVPTCAAGRILGHEGVGIVDAVGTGVTAFHAGERVLISCISACSKCDYCRRGMYSHCATGGWILGNTIDGTQAEYVRIPHADTSLYPLPLGADDEALVMLSDILPTGFECGVLNGKVAPGSTLAIVGSGPIGLAALLTAQFYALRRHRGDQQRRRQGGRGDPEADRRSRRRHRHRGRRHSSHLRIVRANHRAGRHHCQYRGAWNQGGASPRAAVGS